MLRELAAALLIAGLAAFLLQTTAGPGLAAGMARDQSAAVEHGCDHVHTDRSDTQARSSAKCSAAASIAPDDCCQQLCTLAALLPQALGAGGSPGAEEPSGSWLDRPGWSPSAILQPPRIPAVA